MSGNAVSIDWGFTLYEVPYGSHTHRYLDGSITRTTQPAQSSTRRLKKDISASELPNYRKILEIEPQRFKYKREKTQKAQGRDWLHGYMAEDLQSLGLEEVLVYDKKGEATAVRYDLISLYLVELLKEHEATIKELKKRIEKLEKTK